MTRFTRKTIKRKLITPTGPAHRSRKSRDQHQDRQREKKKIRSGENLKSYFSRFEEEPRSSVTDLEKREIRNSEKAAAGGKNGRALRYSKPKSSIGSSTEKTHS